MNKPTPIQKFYISGFALSFIALILTCVSLADFMLPASFIAVDRSVCVEIESRESASMVKVDNQCRLVDVKYGIGKQFLRLKFKDGYSILISNSRVIAIEGK